MTRWTDRTVGAASVAAVTILAGAGLWAGTGSASPQPADPTVEAPAPAVTDPDLSPALALNEAFVALADQVTPAVVRIETRRSGSEVRAEGPAPGLPDGIPEPFRRFFDLPEGPRDPSRPMPRLAGGSGFLVSPDGIIVTNDHVVDGADEITVYLEDGRYFEAELLGQDPTTDVAAVRIDAEGLPHLRWGSSRAVRVGEWVMAVGNPGVGGGPGQLDYTVTTGIVSAKGRPLELIGRSLQRDPAYGQELAGYAIENFIQTDAVINPGNSGGPMVNLRGEVVGINSAIASTSGYYQGYGFAIPADLAHRVVDDLVELGHVSRAALGVSVTGITPEDAEVYELPEVSGVLVQTVSPDGAAAEAGLRQADVIVALDELPVEAPGHLQQLVAERRPGEAVTVTVYRDGGPLEVEVQLGEAPINRVTRTADERPEGRLDRRLGIRVGDLTPQLAERFGFETGEGVVVLDVEPLGPAARRGVAPGLRIVEIAGREVSSAAEVQEALDEVDEGAVVSMVVAAPDGQTRVVNLRAR